VNAQDFSLHNNLANTVAGPMQPLSRSLFSRMRFQMLVVLLVQLIGIYLPLVVPLPVTMLRFEGAWIPVVYTSVVWSSAAALLGFVLMRQLTDYPGKHSVTYIFPCLIFSYSIVAFAIFLLRSDYSRYVIIASFVTVMLWLHFEYWLREHHFVPLLAIVPSGNQRNITKIEMARWILLQNPSIQLRGVEGVVADLNANMGKNWEIFIAKCVLAGIPVYDVKSIMESLTGRVDIEHLSENSFGSVLPSSLYLRMQRGLDLCLALVLLPFFAVAILVAGLFIKLETGGPVFYTQPRMGFRARIFTIYKLRSMRDGVASGKHYTVENDPRITRVGRFIRKYRIDEFPQILNIIKGEMSWIGPRPEAVELADWYANDIPFYIYRHAVRPGLSGWAQVMQGNVAKVDAATIKLQFDFYYIKHFSPWLDLLIVLKTIQTMMSGFGSR
jgi:lipopolysaccharide/colanic/teichoic acid biosynthesis glycosyltransferase